MEYSVAVCDDQAADREFLTGAVRAWAKARGSAVSVSEYPSAESFLFSYPDRDVDILLLDIEMGRMDGVELAKRLRRENDALQIVFVTGYSEYIEEGYEVAALHFLIKPVGEAKLFSVLDRAVERLHRAEWMLTLELGGELARVPLRQIRYVDVHANYVTVHAGEDYTVKRSLSEMAAQLDDRFFRVGRSVIVNLSLICRVTRTQIHLGDGTVIPLPRGAFDAVNRAVMGLEGSYGAF